MPTTLLPARTLSVSIAAPPARVYAFVSDGMNLPAWSYFEGVRQAGDAFEVDTPEGPVTLRFVATNALGVLDHDVTLPSGVVVHVPMRVVPNGGGSELLFTLMRLPGVADDAYEADAQQVARDLAKLKCVLERAPD